MGGVLAVSRADQSLVLLCSPTWLRLNSNPADDASAPRTDFTLHWGRISKDRLHKLLIQYPTILTTFLMPFNHPIIHPATAAQSLNLKYMCLTSNWVLNDLTLTGTIKFKEMCIIELLHINYKYLLAIKTTLHGATPGPTLCLSVNRRFLRRRKDAANSYGAVKSRRDCKAQFQPGGRVTAPGVNIGDNPSPLCSTQSTGKDLC